MVYGALTNKLCCFFLKVADCDQYLKTCIDIRCILEMFAFYECLPFIVVCSASTLSGFLLAFSSNVGQTFFVSLFSGAIRDDLDLSHGEFGALYSGATLGSAMVFLWLGKSTDKYDLSLLGIVSLAGLSGCMMIMASVSSLFVLFAALFGLRLLGQALPGHIAITAMARWFSTKRGRAISIVTLGYPVGEGLAADSGCPLLAAITWREIWTYASVGIIVTVIPALILCSHILKSRKLDQPQNLFIEKEST